MPERRTSALLAIVVMALAVGGCSETTTGAATTGNSVAARPTTTPPPEDRHEAPRVANPLDATRYLTQPCAAISAMLRQKLTIPGQGEADTTSAIGRDSPACRWSNQATVIDGESVSVAFLGNKHGLADLYRQQEIYHDNKYWEETTVEGYPGVFHDGVDSRSAGQCTLAVGVSDALAVLVDESGELGMRSCERVKQVSAAVIQTLKGQG
jgi:uncharacterized protein DUF3558